MEDLRICLSSQTKHKRQECADGNPIHCVSSSRDVAAAQDCHLDGGLLGSLRPLVVWPRLQQLDHDLQGKLLEVGGESSW